MSQALTRLQLHVVNAVQGNKDRGATMVEYGLLVAFIAMVALFGVQALGTNINNLFSGITF